MKKQTIKFAGEAVGALIPDNGQLRFVAVKYSVWSLDGRIFATSEEALRAVASLHVLRQREPVGAGPVPTGGSETMVSAC
ncbi:hypothetical protein [Sinorhizobium sp. CCBAU 05631]|uniref:hypothetical protein n=1 Tax=Sinorhizobium sp. CCBAU 05631 TaxID=794846 RepID=UPI0004B4E43A|nr:hypothetical protein [Sinorhizobium sp. CCBAU 05631]ASY55383.1 hypothetical protein SS05631_c04270 [Sinorhizobium sp. CCBAU 05631]